MWSASTNQVSTVAGTGSASVSSDGSPGNVTDLYSPHGVLVLPTYDVLVVENSAHRIRFISAGGGTVSTWAGSATGEYGFSGDGKAATGALLYNPHSITREPYSGSVYITDQQNYRIRVVLASGIIQTAMGSGGSGYLDSLNPLAALTSIDMFGLAWDGAGSILFVDKQVLYLRSSAEHASAVF
jgi:hypothetical protein